MRAALYLRISRDRTQRAAGVARQRRECENLCRHLGWTIAAVYEDNDRSAYGGKRRPGYEGMLDGIKSGEIDAICAWDPDRLHRRLTELESFVDLVDAHSVAVATVTGGEVDLSTPSGRMMARMKGTVARYESEHRAERLRAMHREKALRGEYSGGARPYGWAPDGVTPVPEEQRVIIELADRVLSGASLNSLRVDLNRRGIPSARGGTWSRRSLKGMLISPRLAGRRTHPTGVRQATWSGAISVEQHRRLVALLTDPSRLKQRAPRVAPLAGLIFCGKAECDGRLVSAKAKRRDGTSVRRMQCSTCHGSSVKSEDAEQHVLSLVVAWLNQARLTPVRWEDHEEGSIDALDDLERRRDDATDAFAAGEIGRGDLARILASIDSRIEQAQQALARDQRLRIARGDDGRPRLRLNFAFDERAGDRFAAGWPTLSLTEQRDQLARIIDRIIVRPGPRSARGVTLAERMEVQFLDYYEPRPIEISSEAWANRTPTTLSEEQRSKPLQPHRATMR